MTSPAYSAITQLQVSLPLRQTGVQVDRILICSPAACDSTYPRARTAGTRTTAADAFERDLTPWIVSDAVYSHAGADPHEAGLLVAGRFIGRDQIVDMDTVLTDRNSTAA